MAETLRRLASGDDGAWHDFLLLAEPLIRRCCRARVPAPIWLDDAVQETFLAIQRGLGTAEWADDRRAVAWITAIASNAARRIRSRETARCARERTGLEADVATPTVPSPIGHVDLDAALRNLPERHRQVVELRFYQGLSPTEVGHQLGVSSNHASQLLSRALRTMRRWLGAGAAGCCGWWGRRPPAGTTTTTVQAGSSGIVALAAVAALALGAAGWLLLPPPPVASAPADAPSEDPTLRAFKERHPGWQRVETGRAAWRFAGAWEPAETDAIAHLPTSAGAGEHTAHLALDSDPRSTAVCLVLYLRGVPRDDGSGWRVTLDALEPGHPPAAQLEFTTHVRVRTDPPAATEPLAALAGRGSQAWVIEDGVVMVFNAEQRLGRRRFAPPGGRIGFTVRIHGAPAQRLTLVGAHALTAPHAR